MSDIGELKCSEGFNEALIVRPGDTLIVAYGPNITHEQVADVKGAILAKLPELADVLVLGSVTQLGVFRPDEPAPPECWCSTCHRGDTFRIMRVCPICGNKRCPRATFHAHACTGSNEPGQAGSAYGSSVESAP